MDEKYEQEFVNIAILDNIVEAQLVDSILNEHDIPHRARIPEARIADDQGLLPRRQAQVRRGAGTLRRGRASSAADVGQRGARGDAGVGV